MFYASLYNQTEYSFLHSILHLEDVFLEAEKHHWSAVAITDKNMSGVFKFCQMAKKKGIFPIIGLQLFLGASKQTSPVLVYAKNEVGYKTLLKLSTMQEVASDSLTYQFIQYNKEGLLCVLPLFEHEVLEYYHRGQTEIFRDAVLALKNSFEDFYIGLSIQEASIKSDFASWIKRVIDMDIHPVFLHKQAYVKKEDVMAYQTLRAIDSSSKDNTLTDLERHMYVLPLDEVTKHQKAHPLLFQNLEKLVQSITFKMEYDGYKMPKYPIASGGKSEQYLTDLCKVGLNKRLKAKRSAPIEAYKKRLLHELKIITSMQFCDYFLVVYDFVKFAKQNNILVGPGRGSAPGSLVSYSLGITDIDPLEYDLLFERFLNPERVTMPDIDMDFPDNERDRVIEYVREKYGKDKVAHISTFGTFKARLAIRDVARVLELSDAVLSEVMQFIPTNSGSLKEIVDNSSQLQRLQNNHEDVYKLLKLALKLEGLPRHTSTHAAGVIISDCNIVEYTALKEGMNGLYQTQFEASDLEKIGLVKIDFLGLKNLNIISTIVKMVEEQMHVSLQMMHLPLDDKKTYQLIASGNTDGVFQLESDGMKNVLRKLKTSTFMDIANANALYRPGPMEMIDTFVRRKFKQEPLVYLHQDLEPILHSTYGIIVFQEQIMLIAQKFAGYTLAMADILRRAVSKKDSEVLEAERDRFVKSCLNNAYTIEVANQLYDYIVKFANYGFNKSHAVSYAMVGYQMAYLKAHYYPFFMSVLMSNSLGSASSLERYVLECRKNQVKILLPSVNYSNKEFVVTESGIYYSLLGIMGFGSATLEQFLEERNKGAFRNYEDFLGRTNGMIPKRIVENMIYAGALDEFGLTRKTMIEKYDQVLSRANYISLIGDKMVDLSVTDEEYAFGFLSTKEKEVLGFNLYYNVFVQYDAQRKKYQTIDIMDLEASTNSVRLLVGIKRIKEIQTKKQETMAFIELHDETASIDAVVFPKIYDKLKEQLKVGYLYIIGGKCEERNEKKQFILENVYMLK